MANSSFFPPTLQICFCPIPLHTMEFNPKEKQCHLFKFKLQFFSFVPFMCIHLSSSAVLAPILQDPSTQLHFLSLYLRTPYQQTTKLLIDPTVSFSWVECTCSNPSSCTYRYYPLPYTSPLCNWPNSPTCSNCSSEPTDPICPDSLCHLFLTRPRNRKRVRVQALANIRLSSPYFSWPTGSFNFFEGSTGYFFDCTQAFRRLIEAMAGSCAFKYLALE